MAAFFTDFFIYLMTEKEINSIIYVYAFNDSLEI
jgi:hypothetical protein